MYTCIIYYQRFIFNQDVVFFSNFSKDFFNIKKLNLSFFFNFSHFKSKSVFPFICYFINFYFNQRPIVEYFNYGVSSIKLAGVRFNLSFQGLSIFYFLERLNCFILKMRKSSDIIEYNKKHSALSIYKLFNLGDRSIEEYMPNNRSVKVTCKTVFKNGFNPALFFSSPMFNITIKI